jgi:lipoyl-dependent peroxiredoxin
MKVLYTTSATVIGGRAGHARSADGALDLELTVPKELGGDGKPGTNPEQLFAAGYAACFQSALRHIAGEQKKTITESSVKAIVAVGPRDAGGFGLRVDLEVALKGMSRADAEELVSVAHNVVCPYSNALRGNVDVNVKVL